MPTKNFKKLDKLMGDTAKIALDIYVEECQRVLRRTPSLSHLVAAMGSAFFVDKRGEIIHESNDLPAMAKEFMYDTDSLYYDYFKSPGIAIYVDKIVTNW